MNCLQIEQIYLYLEKELSPSELKEIEEHLVSCPKCREQVEERRLLLQAAETLPEFEVPPDFTKKVMSRIFPAKAFFFGWRVTLATAFSFLFLSVLLIFLALNKNLPNFILSFTHTLGNSVKNMAVIFVKFFKLTSLFFKILLHFLGELSRMFSLLTTLISPEIVILVFAAAFILVLSSIYGIKSKFLAGEKL